MHKIQCKKDNYSSLLEWKLYIVHNVKKRFLDREMDGNGDNNTEKQRSANVPLGFNCGYSSIQVWTQWLHAVKPGSLAATGHCPRVSYNVKTEDYCGIWSEIECCLLYPAQSLGVAFEMRDKTRKSPSRHWAMIFSSITMRDHFIPIYCWKEGIKACNHLKGLPFALQNILGNKQ